MTRMKFCKLKRNAGKHFNKWATKRYAKLVMETKEEEDADDKLARDETEQVNHLRRIKELVQDLKENQAKLRAE